ncbi:DUF2264 domain-containing protein [Kibdelosporangium aridum]|uniref:DUF2264 domain-containing protein n=1 Tax=Kibdelosporangium aridum TaxID=2030 RepID=UPI000527072E
MMPPEDHDRSPYTGWTRAHWVMVADEMLAAVEPYWSPGGARLDLPGPTSRNGEVSDGLEGFARTFLLAGFRVAGERGADPSGLLERYAHGLAVGTDPGSSEAWPRPDTADQAKVEAASIALVLQLTRPWLWDQLDSAVQDRVIAWLSTVVGQPYPPINWVWFRIVVESFLREVGGPWSAEDIYQDLSVHQSLRRADGWLSDGRERSYDHYTGWALHLYPLLWTHLFDVTGTLCPQSLRDLWASDLTRYLDDAAVLVGADGSPLMQGRSLAYRFAAAAPFWVGAITGTGEHKPGLARRAASGVLRHFVDRGALAPDGLLRLGWHREWTPIRQSYSGPGSPYWAAKGMLGLALPADHPVWTDVECPLPVETGDVARVITAPGWLVSARQDTGIVTVINHGTDHALPGDTRADAPLYARLAYSTATMPPLVDSHPVDSSVCLLDGNGVPSHRSGFHTLFVRERPGGVLVGASHGPVRWVDTNADTSPDHGSGRSGPITPGPPVLVASVVRDGVEIRLVRVDGETSSTLRLSGWPVAADQRPHIQVEGLHVAVTAAMRSCLRGVRGFDHAGVDDCPGTSPLGAYGFVPWLATAAAPVPGRVLAAAVWLDRGGPEPAIPVVTVEHNEISLRWSDGLDTRVTLPNP